MNLNQNLSGIDYFVTETGKFDSIDPLDADKTQNISVAQNKLSSMPTIAEIIKLKQLGNNENHF